jgi:hypothetical protein
MNQKEYFEKLEKFRNTLKKLDEKLYYDFLNLYDVYLMNLQKQTEDVEQRLKISDNKIINYDLKLIKLDREILDDNIKIKNDINAIKKNFSPEKYTGELFDKLIDNANAIGLAVMGRPRLFGFMLLLNGYSGIERLSKFIDENRENLKKYNPTNNMEGNA